jgi:hypothetical protein
MYVGDSSRATAEKGAELMKLRVDSVVRALRAIKTDQVTPELLEEFLAAAEKPELPDHWTEATPD